MNETSRIYNNQINNLISMIDEYSGEIDKITAEIREYRDLYNAGHFVYYKEFTFRQHKLKILNKKIQECISTISHLSDKVEYEEVDFANDVNMIHLRAEIIQNTMPNSVNTGNVLTFSVKVKNVGLDTWSQTNAHLNIDITNIDSSYNKTYSFALDVGEEIPLGSEKTFATTIPAFVDNGVYNVSVYMSNDTYHFEREYQYLLYVTN